jgi:hypothetical protein
MSSTGQATSSTSQAASSISNIQLITEALADYVKITGINLSEHPLATALERANSPEAIVHLLEEQAKAVKDFRDENPRLISCLSLAANVIQAFYGILSEADMVSHKDDLITLLYRLRQVPFPLAKALFVAINVLLAVRPSNALVIRFLCDV